MKVVILALIILLQFTPVQADVDPCKWLISECKPLTDYEKCLKRLERRGVLDDFHKPMCSPFFIPSSRPNIKEVNG